MPLYFDTFSNKFCVEPNSNTKLVCSDITENTRKNGKDAPPIICCDGKYKIQIDAYFDSNYEHRSYMRAKVVIDGVLMLPISQYNPDKPTDKRLSVSEHHINYFNQWHHKGPYTIAQGAYRRTSPISNERLFSLICEICNDTNTWIEKEICTLVKNCRNYISRKRKGWIHPSRLASSILLMQRYDKFVSIQNLCGKTFENDCLNILKSGMDIMLSQTNYAHNIDKVIHEYDVIWQYVKDCYMWNSK